jgi:PAS domain S-box-containing protein
MPENEKRKLSALTDITSIDITSDFDEILKNILKITCESMNAHSGTIMLLDEKTNELRMTAQYGLPEDYIEQVYKEADKAGMPISSSPSGTVLKTGHYYLVPDISKEPKDKPWLELSSGLGFRSQIYTPLMRGMKVVGLLNVYMPDVHHFTEEEIDFVTIAAYQASSVVQNARLCIRLKNNVVELNKYKVHLEDKLKESHKKLFLSENYLRSIIESSFDGIIVLDEQGKFEFVNDSFLRITGWTKEELIGDHFMKVMPEDMNEFILQKLNEVQKGIPDEFETRIITKNGQIRYVKASNTITIINGEKKFVSVSKDITENKNLEMALKESEAKYRELFENANEAMYTHDLKGKFLSLNKIGSQLLGATVEEIIGSNIKEWLAPHSFELFEDRVRKIFLNQPLEQPVVIEVITRNAEHKWGEVTTRLIKDGDRIIGVHGIARDITEKIRLEKKLKESEEKYRELFNNANDCIYTIDLNGQFLTVNDSVVKAMKCDSVEEVLTSNMSKWMTQKSLEDAIKFIQEIITKEDYYKRSVVIEIIRKDGIHVWFEHKARPIKDNNNNIIGLHGIGRDITDKKKLEQELKESEAKYRDLFENAQDAMYVLDNEINFLKMNTKGIEILGCTKEEVIGSNISRWITPESLRIIQERQKNVYPGKRSLPQIFLSSCARMANTGGLK